MTRYVDEYLRVFIVGGYVLIVNAKVLSQLGVTRWGEALETDRFCAGEEKLQSQRTDAITHSHRK